MIEAQPPNWFVWPKELKSIFLGGTIDMGVSIDWQAWLVKEMTGQTCLLFNPRRDDWDSSWATLENDNFVHQLSWEWKYQERADLNVYYFAPESKSPITLMELGHFGTKNDVIVCCPKGFWRKGNVDFYCRQHDVKQVDGLPELVEGIKEFLK